MVKKKLATKKQKKILATMKDNLCDSEDLNRHEDKKNGLELDLIFWSKLFLQVLLSSTTLEKGVLVSTHTHTLSLSLNREST
jgi:hypothetical protein